MDTQELKFELPNTKLLTVEELEKALAEEQEIADQLIRNAEARKKAIKQQIADAKAEAKKESLHKLTTILQNLRAEYGQDFVEIAKKIIAKKLPLNPRKPITDAEELKKFEHLKNRGYYAIKGETFGIKGNKISASIPSQKGFEPYFTMNPNKFAKMYADFKENELT